MHPEPSAAFTLIELLVVISVIALLAGMLLPVSAAISRRYKISRVTSELNQLATSIETYKLELGVYPPDNVNLRTVTLNGGDRFISKGQSQSANRANDNAKYFQYAAENPLFYELLGCTFDNGYFQVNRM